MFGKRKKWELNLNTVRAEPIRFMYFEIAIKQVWAGGHYHDGKARFSLPNEDIWSW